MKGKINLVGILLVIVALTGCIAGAIRYDGTYRGKIVDADTGAPIEGVVVLGVWSVGRPTVAGAVYRYYDARETVTDKDGEFSIAGMGLSVRMISYIDRMIVHILKAGYEYTFGRVGWSEVERYVREERNAKPEGNKVIIPLKKLTLEARKRSMKGPSDPPGGAPFEKVKRYLRELDKDNVQKGFKRRGLWEGVRYE